MKGKSRFLSFLFLGLGLILLINNLFDLNLFNPEKLWPLFVLVIGLTFELVFFLKRKNPGLLVPGGILTIAGLLFLFETLTGWRYSAYTWPIYPLSVAVGLFQVYIFSRNKGLLMPVGILGALSILSFSIMAFDGLFAWLNMSYALPFVIILIGLGLFFKEKLK